jgi:hypothetical protein
MRTLKTAIVRLTRCETWVDTKITVYDIVASWRETGLEGFAFEDTLFELRERLHEVIEAAADPRAVTSARWSLEVLDEFLFVP